MGKGVKGPDIKGNRQKVTQARKKGLSCFRTRPERTQWTGSLLSFKNKVKNSLGKKGR